MTDEINRVKFHQRVDQSHSTMKCFTIELSNASAQLYQDNTLSFHIFSTGAIESGWLMGECNFGNILPISVPKHQRVNRVPC